METATENPTGQEVNDEGQCDETNAKKTTQWKSNWNCLCEADYLVFKGFCFFIYGAYGGLIPFLSLYFKQLFLGPSYVGIIVGIRPLIQCIGAPFWGIIAERYHAGKIIFLGSILAWIIKAFVLISIRPNSQYCIEVYENGTVNLTYVYAYDLWKTEAEEKPDWVVFPISNPVLVETNKIAVIESLKMKKQTPQSIPQKVLTRAGPADLARGIKIVEKDKKRLRLRRVNSSDTNDDNNSAVHRSLSQEKSEITPPNESHKKHGKKTTDLVIKERRDITDKMSESLRFKIVYKVIVDSKEMNAPVQFITEVDKNEIDFMFVMFMIIIIIGEFFESSTYTLSDASLLKRLGKDKEYYGRVRMWGSLGWAVTASMVGFLVNSSTFKLCEVEKHNYVIAFYIFIGFVAAAFANALWFRFSYEEEIQFEDIGKVAPILANFRHLSYLLATLYTGFCYGILVHFINWFIDDLGGSSTIMGTAGTAREITALVTFGLSAHALNAFGNVNVMLLCLMSYIICFILYSMLTNPWMAIALEVLDGGTYGLVWSTCVNYMSKVGSKLGVVESTQEQAANGRGAVDLNTENERSRCRFCSLLRPANMARENGAGMPSFGAKVRQADDASVRFRLIMASFRDARNL
ncbi:major facilitator superfamily domain-containing protein 6-like isoform X2 [Acropora millepora]|uniref:major facilitator superfamily domain-containing protein 6-like isoform X2 n=1 Tax=Acropora millepora TaxID=45264 RepID=UPI001CF1A96D|nr:major facilitator superfamily domain-containing protein 6-like isoform X2 [Acropora millepora]